MFLFLYNWDLNISFKASGVVFQRNIRCVSDPKPKLGRTSAVIYNSLLHILCILEEITWILLLYYVTNKTVCQSDSLHHSSFHLWSKIHVAWRCREAITSFLTSFFHFIHYHSQHEHSRTQVFKSKISAGGSTSKMHNNIAWLTVWWNVYFSLHRKQRSWPYRFLCRQRSNM